MIKQSIDIDRVLKLQAEIDSINKLDLPKVDFYKDGKLINISKAAIHDFKYTGLNNFYFIAAGFYEG